MYYHFHLNNENTYLYQILLHKHTNRFRFMLLNKMHVRSLHKQTLRYKKPHTKHLDFTYFEHRNLFIWRVGLINPDIPGGQLTLYLNNSR